MLPQDVEMSPHQQGGNLRLWKDTEKYPHGTKDFMASKGPVRKDFSHDPQLKQHFHVKNSVAEAVLQAEELSKCQEAAKNSANYLEFNAQ